MIFLRFDMCSCVVAAAALKQIDELAVDAALMDLRLRWWWQWQQIDELAVDAALMDFEVALVVAVAADR